MAKAKGDPLAHCTNPVCVELRDAFHKAEEKIKDEAAKSGNPSIEMLAKRLLRTMNNALYVFERLVDQTIKDESVLTQRIRNAHDALRMEEYGFYWDEHLSGLDNLLMLHKQGAAEMQWGRRYLFRLREAVKTDDDELVLKVAHEISAYPEMQLPENHKEEALRGIELKHPRDISTIREMDARARLKTIFNKYKLNELGFSWFEDLSAVDNAILIVREGSYRLLQRWCYLMELGFAVQDGDVDKIVAKAKEVFDLAPAIIISRKLYEDYCGLLTEIQEDYDAIRRTDEKGGQ